MQWLVFHVNLSCVLPVVFSYDYPFIFSPWELYVLLPLTYPFPYFIPQSSNPVQRHSSLSLGGTDSEDEQVKSCFSCYWSVGESLCGTDIAVLVSSLGRCPKANFKSMGGSRILKGGGMRTVTDTAGVAASLFQPPHPKLGQGGHARGDFFEVPKSGKKSPSSLCCTPSLLPCVQEDLPAPPGLPSSSLLTKRGDPPVTATAGATESCSVGSQA